MGIKLGKASQRLLSKALKDVTERSRWKAAGKAAQARKGSSARMEVEQGRLDQEERVGDTVRDVTGARTC